MPPQTPVGPTSAAPIMTDARIQAERHMQATLV
jgi:hypothetical protein